MPKLWVYISGPYTKDDPVVNSRNAITAGDQVLAAGHVPIIPHLSIFWHILFPKPWETWIDYDIELIQRCDILWRLPGESKGADLEVAEAARLYKPVVYAPTGGFDWSKLNLEQTSDVSI